MSETATTKEPTAAPTGRKKTRVGIVISQSGNKSLVVRVDSRVPHPQFRKIVLRSKKIHVHDEDSAAKVGDRVSVVETRPLSRLKRWRLVEVLSH